MPLHETKYCPRCNETFECKVGDIVNCQCNEVTLCEDAVTFLGKTQYGCLCKDCLIEINSFVQNAKEFHFPEKKDILVEGLHYYREGNNWVFTELYHYLKGNCCGNGCRHCVYGHKPEHV